MPSAMEVILLERVSNLGHMGEIVKVRPGYARNYLLPQKKALRATKDNLAYFESKRAALEKLNDEKKAEAGKLGKKIGGLNITLIRLSSETGQLFGSVGARDIAQAVTEASGIAIQRNQVVLHQTIKTLGLFPVAIALHPEVEVEVKLNIARTEEEAKIQAETGRAVVGAAAALDEDAAEEAKKGLLEDSAIAAEQEWAAEEAQEAADKAEKAAKRATKKAAKAADEDAGEEAGDEAADEAAVA